MHIDSYSWRETTHLGRKFSDSLGEGDVVILEGALGGGKTTFVKGVLKGLGYRRRVLSPTFTLLRQYRTKEVCIYHLDLYRLKREELFDLGLEDLLYSEGSVSLIEWGDKIKEDLDRYIKLEFLYRGEDRRRLIFSARGYSKEKINSIEKVLRK